MKLKNYTSSISVERSLEAIDTLLVQAGATHIARAYTGTEGKISAILFQLNVNGRPFTFKLPSNPEAVYRIFKAEIKKPHHGTFEKLKDQADRTSWSIIREWVHIQLSMIKMQQAEALEIFLPYLYDGRKDSTFYSQLKETGYKQLVAAQSDANFEQEKKG